VDAEVGAVRNELQHYKLYQELIAHAEVIAAEGEEDRIAEASIASALGGSGSSSRSRKAGIPTAYASPSATATMITNRRTGGRLTPASVGVG